MNGLVERFGDRLCVIGFPCNQFFRQGQEKEYETLSMLKHVRPGGGFEPNFPLTQRVEVNGVNAHPIFQWLREALPAPADDGGKHIMGDHTRISWSPVSRDDLSWNFEKFLIDSAGRPQKRYSPKFATASLATDIEALLDPVANP